MRSRARHLKLLAGAVVLAALLLVLVGGALSSGGTQSWQWQSAASPGTSRHLVATTSASGEITLAAKVDPSGLAKLSVSANGRTVQEASAASLSEDGPLATFVVGDGVGGEVILGVARSDVAHVLLRSEGAVGRELLLNAAGAFAASDITPGPATQLEALAGDGSTIARIELPTTAAICGASGSCSSGTDSPAFVPASTLRGTSRLASATPLYAVLESWSKGVVRDDLTRLDPATWNPVGARLKLGGPQGPPEIGPMALSPDQKRFAVAAIRGGVVQIVDLGSLRVTRHIATRTGITARSLGWLDNDQLALIGQQMGGRYGGNVVGRWLIRVNVGRGSVTAKALPKKAALQYSQRAGSRLIVVLVPNDVHDPHRTVVVADADGRTFIVPVTLPAPIPGMFEDRPVASADGTHLYIVRAGGQILDLDIEAGTTEVHQVEAPSDAPSTLPQSSYLLAEATGGGLVVSGVFTFERGGDRVFRSGVYRIDTNNWKATTLDRSSSSFVVYGDKVATYKSAPFATPPTSKAVPLGRGTGVTVYSATSGDRAYHVFDNKLFSYVRLINGYGHALRSASTPGVTHSIVDSRFNAETGAALGQSRPPLNGLRLIYRGSPDIHEPGSVASASATRKYQRATSTSTGSMPRAFDRPRKATDALPRAIRVPVPARAGASETIIATRRIASYTDGRGRRALLYLAKTAHQVCYLTFWRGGAGGGCSPSTNFFGGGHIVVGSSHLLSGVADDDVASLVVVGSRGVRHPVTVTADGGFIYDCKAYNGCTCVVDHVEAFDSAGVKIASDHVGGRCRRS